jgi:hypothetical protein
MSQKINELVVSRKHPYDETECTTKSQFEGKAFKMMKMFWFRKSMRFLYEMSDYQLLKKGLLYSVQRQFQCYFRVTQWKHEIGAMQCLSRFSIFHFYLNLNCREINKPPRTLIQSLNSIYILIMFYILHIMLGCLSGTQYNKAFVQLNFIFNPVVQHRMT